MTRPVASRRFAPRLLALEPRDVPAGDVTATLVGAELRLVGKDGLKQRPVFMAIAEECGHGRRGETRHVRAADGTEVVVTREVVERWERDGRIEETTRRKALKELADDLPWVAEQYRLHLRGKLRGRGVS